MAPGTRSPIDRFLIARSRPDLLLLISLLVVILAHPVLDHGDLRRLVLSILTFIPVVLATLRLAEKKHWVVPSVVLMLAAVIFSVLSALISNRVLLVAKWALLAAFFGFAVVGLFSYLRNAGSVAQSHLLTAVSIYLMLAMLWFALYSVIDTAYPGSFQRSNATIVDRESELLYFSLITLTTIGYGDIVPLTGEARMLSALEGVAGVLYVAITVAILVSAFKRQGTSSPE